MYLIVAIRKKDYKEFIYKKYKTQKRAENAFEKICDNVTLNKDNFRDYDFELHDEYGEIINCTL